MLIVDFNPSHCINLGSSSSARRRQLQQSSVALEPWGGTHVCSVTDGHLYLHFTDGQRRAPSRVSTRHGRSATRAKPCLHAALLSNVAPTARSCISRKDFNSPLHSILPPPSRTSRTILPPHHRKRSDQTTGINTECLDQFLHFKAHIKVENSGKSNIFLDFM